MSSGMSSASAVPFHVLIEISKREESGLAYSISFRNFSVRMLGNAVNKIVAAFNSRALWGCRCRYAPGLGCLLRCRGHLVKAPAPAERLVYGDEGDHPVPFALNELVFRPEDGTLAVEPREEPPQPAVAAARCQPA